MGNARLRFRGTAILRQRPWHGRRARAQEMERGTPRRTLHDKKKLLTEVCVYVCVCVRGCSDCCVCSMTAPPAMGDLPWAICTWCGIEVSGPFI